MLVKGPERPALPEPSGEQAVKLLTDLLNGGRNLQSLRELSTRIVDKRSAEAADLVLRKLHKADQKNMADRGSLGEGLSDNFKDEVKRIMNDSDL